MAITDSQKIDYIWKKVGYGATKTDTNANKLAPNEAIPSPLLVRGDRVWNQSSSIPSVAPSSSSGVVTCYKGTGVVETTADATATQNRTWKTDLTDWIPPQFGSTYIVNVYIHDSSDAANAASISNRVFVTGSGNNDEWFFDYESGVLNFIGTNLPNGHTFTGKSVYIEGCRYTGTFGVGSSGGGSSLGDITAEGTTLSTPTNDDLILEPQGTGIVVINSTASFKLPVGTTAQRPTSPDEGEVRYNSTLDQVEVYKNGSWERVGDPDTATLVHDEFDGDGSTTDFTLSNSASTNTVMVSNNGVLQEPTNAYTVSGTTLSFTEAPESADKISVRVFSNITSLDKIQDADSDTKIEVERTSDDDTIRFSTAGTERLTIDSTGIELTTTEDSSSAGPIITLKRNSASPADGDYLGQLKFQGENDADQSVLYAKITGKISDVTDTTEDGLLEFSLRKAGSNHIGARLTSTDLKLINSTGLEVAGDTTLSGKLKFASYTTTQRDALTPGNGDVIYNSTTDKFQGYAGGSWVDLH